ncbi:vesicle-associated membrane protein 1 isoform X2 [Rhinolophus sinicus]|uniref:vesicle-associated membrane protein 1 isoform X2 n=1 Tax=Rhinolophus sinicus TaxID=89399 RepID=UPI003D79FC0E
MILTTTLFQSRDERRAVIGQFAWASLQDWRLFRAWIGPQGCQPYRVGVAGTNKDWYSRGNCSKFHRRSSCGWSTRGGAGQFRRLQPQRFPRGCLPAASGEKTDPPSVREMSAPAQPPTEGAEGTAPGGGPPGPPPNTSSNRRLQQTQAQVEEVVDIMRVNVDKVLKRDEILSELDDRADALQMGASQFESSAAKLKRKYWWKNCKMMIMLGAICAIIVVVIVSGTTKKWGSGKAVRHMG